MAEEEEEEEEPEPPPQGSPARYFFVILLILIIEGVGAYLFLDYLIPPVEEYAQQADAEDEPLERVTIPTFYTDMQQMVINLPATKGGHLVQISLAFQVDTVPVLDEIALKESILWDLVIRRLETYSLAQIRDPDKQALREDVQKTLNKELKNGEITEVFFTDLVVQ